MPDSAISTGSPTFSDKIGISEPDQVTLTRPEGENQDAAQYNKEIEDEDRTAINSISYIFFSVIILACGLGLTYACKRYHSVMLSAHEGLN